MVNRRMRQTQALSLVRKLARKKEMSVEELPGRGRGSHRLYRLVDSDGSEVARFGFTDHGSKDLSWTVLTELENQLAQVLGDRWTEKR